MRKYRNHWITLTLTATLAIYGCGNEDSPAGPSAVPSPTAAQAAGSYQNNTTTGPGVSGTSQQSVVAPTMRSASDGGSQSDTTTAPGSVRDLAGEQTDNTNSVLLTWKPPLSGTAINTSITGYTLTRDGYDTHHLGTDVCIGSGLETSCQHTVTSLSHDPHVFAVSATNSSGTSQNETITVNVTEDQTPAASTTTPVTAQFGTTPTTHDGTTAFNVTLTFSENVAIGYRTLRDGAISVQNGNVTRARRRQRGSSAAWTLTVQPSGAVNVTLTLPATPQGSLRDHQRRVHRRRPTAVRKRDADNRSQSPPCRGHKPPGRTIRNRQRNRRPMEPAATSGSDRRIDHGVPDHS